MVPRRYRDGWVGPSWSEELRVGNRLEDLITDPIENTGRAGRIQKKRIPISEPDGKEGQVMAQKRVMSICGFIRSCLTPA